MHKDRLKIIETIGKVLPSINAIEVIDYFAEGKSEADVQGVLRIDGKKLSTTIIKIVFSHIKLIEDTMMRMLDGTSIVYNPPLDEDEQVLFVAKTIPTTKPQLISNIMFVIGLSGKDFVNVYDANFSELTTQVTRVVDNVITAQSGSFEELRDALKPE